LTTIYNYVRDCLYRRRSYLYVLLHFFTFTTKICSHNIWPLYYIIFISRSSNVVSSRSFDSKKYNRSWRWWIFLLIMSENIFMRNVEKRWKYVWFWKYIYWSFFIESNNSRSSIECKNTICIGKYLNWLW